MLVANNARAPGFQHWDDSVKAYVVDCTLGVEGPRKENFNMRWIGSLVSDAFRDPCSRRYLHLSS
jgi:fructose-1,6-bisphosphatase